MSVHLINGSFNAGLLDPLLDARVAVEKYADGCRILENFIVETHGPVSRRVGMVHLGFAGSQVVAPRLEGFQFASGPIMAEFGSGQFRFWNAAGVLLAATVAHPYSDAELFEVQFVQVNDVVFVTHYAHVPRLLSHFSDSVWTLLEVHEPAGGWPTGAGVAAPPVVGNAVRELWYSSGSGVTSLAAADAWIAGHSPQTTFNNSAAPVGLGSAYVSSIQRVRAWFVPLTSGNYTFKAVSVDDLCRVRLETAASGTGSGAVTILSGTGTVTAGAAYALTAGLGYWIEFLLSDSSRPSAGSFQFKIGAGAYADVTAGYLSASKTGALPATSAIVGWPAMLDENLTATTVAASSTAIGTLATLTASAALWSASSVGSWLQIAHQRDTAFSEYVGVVGAFAGSSTALRLIGRYEIFTYGIWEGTLHLEKLGLDGVTWSVERSWVGKNDRQVTVTGFTDAESTYRLSVVAGVGTGGTVAVPRFLLEAADSKIYGLVRITAFTDSTHVDAVVYGSIHATTATTLWTAGAWSIEEGYPCAMVLHEQRTIYAGTAKHPQSLWASVLGDFYNFRRSSLDDGSWYRTLASDSSHRILWLLSQENLLIGTNRGYWSAESPAGGVLTPLGGTFTKRSGAGSSYMPAIMANESPVFLQSNGRTLRRMVFRADVGRYGSGDLSVLAPHLTASGVRQMVWQSQSRSIIWSVLNDGRLLGLTLEEEQNVFAWHDHRTTGQNLSNWDKVRSVAVLSGDQGNTVWFSIERDGGISIERFDDLTYSEDPDTLENLRAVHLDSAFVWSDAVTPVRSFSGLHYPTGAYVLVMVNGAQLGSLEVTAGVVNFPLDWPDPYHVVMGYPFRSRVQKMKPEIPLPDGTGQGRVIKLVSTTLRLHRSGGGDVLEAEDTEWALRTVVDYGGWTPGLFSGDLNAVVESSHRSSVDAIVYNDSGYAFTLCALMMKVDIYEA